MDFLPILFLILFVIIGGVIAVIADNVGRKLGKKRLHLGRLRPRHTAMLGTFLVGVSIASLTILLVALSSSDVRTWILRGRIVLQERDQAIRELGQLKVQRQQQLAENRDLEGSIRKQSRQIEDQRGKLAGLRNQLADLGSKVEASESAVRTANRRIADLDTKRAVTQKRLDEKLRTLQTLQDRLTKVNGSLALSQKQLSAATKEANGISIRNLELVHQNLALQAETVKAQADISDVKAQIERLRGERDDLQRARDQVSDELELKQRQLNASQADLLQVRSQLDSVRQQLTMAQIDSQVLAAIGGQARRMPIMYQAGDEVVRLSVPGGLSVKAAEDMLTSLLRSARVAAQNRGAKRNDVYAEAGLVEHSDPTTKRTITPAEIERSLVERIAGSSGPVVLIATSSINAFRGEPVSLEIGVAPNPMVYAKGEVITEERIDGTREVEDVFQQLADFIRGKLKEQAQKAHMIPRIGAEENYGEIGITDLVKLAARVRATNREIRVQALALEDTRAADPLRIEFRLR